MAAFASLLGDKLAGKDGSLVTAEALEGKTVGLYFSAHWCPPCRGFTPQLKCWYETDLQAKGFEVVFVSSDKTEEEFSSYFGEMPWLALPFEDRDRKAALSKKFKVQGIPMLVLLNSEGELITKEGRAAVSEDPTGADFPWIPKPLPPLKEQLGTKFVRGDAEVGTEAIEGKVLGLYFSAHWCPPCRGFTPVFAEAYKKYQAKGLNFEVIFVSSDRDEEEWRDYKNEMPWLALPYSDRAAKNALTKRFGISGIPDLVIVDADGKVITKNGRSAIDSDPLGNDFPWYSSPVRDLAEPEGLEDTTSVVVLMESLEKAEQKSLTAALEPLAKKYGNPGEDAKYLFFTATKSAGPVPHVRQMLGQQSLDQAGSGCGFFRAIFRRPSRRPSKAKAEGASVFILDLDDDGAYYEGPTGSVTVEDVQTFLDNYEAKKLTRKQVL